jgi:ribonuclease HI
MLPHGIQLHQCRLSTSFSIYLVKHVEIWLDYCTNNQAEYEVILLGLQILSSMGVKHVEAFGVTLLVMKQVAGMF